MGYGTLLGRSRFPKEPETTRNRFRGDTWGRGCLVDVKYVLFFGLLGWILVLILGRSLDHLETQLFVTHEATSSSKYYPFRVWSSVQLTYYPTADCDWNSQTDSSLRSQCL